MKEDVRQSNAGARSPRAMILDFNEMKSYGRTSSNQLNLSIADDLTDRINEANQLDEGLHKVVVAFSHLETPEQGNVSKEQLTRYKTLVGQPHTATLQELTTEVKKLNELGTQCEQAMLEFSYFLSAKRFLSSVKLENLTNLEKVEKYSALLDEIEADAYEKAKEYVAQCEVVREKCARAIDISKTAESFRSSNFNLLQNCDKWATMYQKLFSTPESTPSIASCLDEERFHLIGESYYRRRIQLLEQSIPQKNNIQTQLETLSKSKLNYLHIYQESPERFK